jgi:hypothetical protein
MPQSLHKEKHHEPILQAQLQLFRSASDWIYLSVYSLQQGFGLLFCVLLWDLGLSVLL